MIKDASNINHSCPYVVRFLIKIIYNYISFLVDLQGTVVLNDFHRISLPLPFPSGDYLSRLDFLINGKTKFYVNVNMHVPEDL